MTVGKKSSLANYYVDTPVDVSSLLQAFFQISLKRQLSLSSKDIRTMEINESINNFSKKAESFIFEN